MTYMNREIDEALGRLPYRDSSPSVVSVVPPPWPTLDSRALHGIAGEAVKLISPHSEADPVALLVQFLVMAGNLVGRAAYYQVESDRHHANLFAVLVGASAKGRKGTSMGRVRGIVKEVDPTWVEDRMKGGLSSGEGLINEVRDEVQKWDAKAGQFEVVDPGCTDKRLMVTEAEFAGALAVAERHGNTLSPIIRRAWDGDKLATITRNSPLSATGAHISIVGHITDAELRARITQTDLANGLANRFLFLLIKRSKELPFGGALDDRDVQALGERLKLAVENARSIGRVQMSADCRNRWATVYGPLSAPQPGLLGAITARAEAQVVRLALLYALLDGEVEIGVAHLEAALAVWEYAEASAAYVFGSTLGDPVADEIERALKQAGTSGMSRSALRDLFGRNKSSDRIGAALTLLHAKGRSTMEMRPTAGRPVETWIATAGAR